jgi:pimeloyl-ACP methyl ester carboxylesterase
MKLPLPTLRPGMKEPVLILIHGYPFDRTLWYPVVAALGSRVKALLPDLPGFGSVPPLLSKPSMEGYADYVVNFTRSHGVEKAVFAGMSMGGYVALAIADKYPGMTLGLGLISSQAAADNKETKETRRKLIDRITSEGVQAAIAAIVPKLFARGGERNPELLQHPTQGAQQAGISGLTWAMEAMASRPDRTDLLSQFKHPILIAHGLEDQLIPIQKARQLAEKLDKLVSMPLPGAGHVTPLEAPDLLANALDRLMGAVREELAVKPLTAA